MRTGPRTVLVLTLASTAALLMFTWPLLLRPPAGVDQVAPPFVFLALLPVVIVVVLAEVSEGGMDAKTLAMLAVLTAVNAALRSLGAGIAGIELVFFLLVLAGRVFGPAFGFVLGCRVFSRGRNARLLNPRGQRGRQKSWTALSTRSMAPSRWHPRSPTASRDRRTRRVRSLARTTCCG